MVVIDFMLILHGNLFNFDYIPTEKAKELALKEYHSQDSTNKHLKAEVTYMIVNAPFNFESTSPI